jgi:hypothetical protein
MFWGLYADALALQRRLSARRSASGQARPNSDASGTSRARTPASACAPGAARSRGGSGRAWHGFLLGQLRSFSSRFCSVHGCCSVAGSIGRRTGPWRAGTRPARSLQVRHLRRHPNRSNGKPVPPYSPVFRGFLFCRRHADSRGLSPEGIRRSHHNAEQCDDGDDNTIVSALFLRSRDHRALLIP